MLFNENLKWQKNYNAEFGIETYFWRTSVSLVGFFNKTKAPYAYQKTYTPFSYNIMTLSAGYKVSDNTLSWDYRNDWSHTSLPHFPLFQLHGD